jgi:hypothetical protein
MRTIEGSEKNWFPGEKYNFKLKDEVKLFHLKFSELPKFQFTNQIFFKTQKELLHFYITISTTNL